VGRLLFNVLAMVAEFEADLISTRTREGLAVSRAKGRLRGGRPSCLRRRSVTSLTWSTAASNTGAEIAELFGVARSTIYRAVDRARAQAG
jgi:DNA invertase Pin-like site-specific DNA recombinase